MKKIIMSTLVASALAFAGGDIAPVEPVVTPEVTQVDSGLKHNIMIYGWLPDIEGSLNYPFEGETATVDASDILDALKMVFMGSYGVRNDQWSFKADAIYLNLGNSKQTSLSFPNDNIPDIDVNADLSLKAWVLGFYGGYNTMNTDKVTLDLIAGLRYLSLEADATLSRVDGQSLPPLDKSAELWDGVIGIAGQVSMNENWYIPYHFDIGAGDSEFTWQAMAGVGYHYSWGDLILAYRHLDYEGDNQGLVHDLSLSGPALAVNFRF